MPEEVQEQKKAKEQLEERQYRNSRAAWAALKQGKLERALSSAKNADNPDALRAVGAEYMKTASAKKDNPAEAQSALEKAVEAYKAIDAFSGQRSAIQEMLSLGNYQQALQPALYVDATSGKGARNLLFQIGNMAKDKKDFETAAKAYVAGDYESRQDEVCTEFEDWGQKYEQIKSELEQIYNPPKQEK